MLMRFVFFSDDFSEVITTRVSFAANTSKNKLQVLINKRDPRRACTEFILRLEDGIPFGNPGIIPWRDLKSTRKEILKPTMPNN